jgi:hypothetical protein
MTNLPDIREELDIAARAVESYRERFTKLGLEFLRVRTEQSQLAGDSAAFVFHHTRSGVRLTLSIFPSVAGKRRSAVVIITNQRGQTLNVNDYLTVHKQEKTRAEFTADRDSTDIVAFVERVVGALLILLTTDLKTIMEGSHWEEIPIDWAGYR